MLTDSIDLHFFYHPDSPCRGVSNDFQASNEALPKNLRLFISNYYCLIIVC